MNIIIAICNFMTIVNIVINLYHMTIYAAYAYTSITLHKQIKGSCEG